MAQIQYQIGDIVEYQPFGGGLRAVRVTGRDIHNGEPSFDGTCGDMGVWGYDDQIIRVHRVTGGQS